MNILFVSYGEITNNTGSQFTVVARELSRMGHHCLAAVPKIANNLSYSDSMQLPCATYKNALSQSTSLFPNKSSADLVVAITPREIIRRFVEDYFQDHYTPLIVHLEDNEDELTERFTLRPVKEIRNLPHDQIHDRIIPPGLSCPVCWPTFLSKADGFTYIHPALQKLAPESLPSHQFSPPLDFDLFDPDKYHTEADNLRQKFNIATDEKIISYVGNTHAANIENIKTLYSVIHRLNQSGLKTRLLRTGNQSLDFYDSLPFDPSQFTTDLGFIPRTQIPSVIAAADLVIMPTHPDPYDNHRLPSSLPEHLAMGKCVITSTAGLGAELQDGINAAIPGNCNTETLLARCLELFENAKLRRTIGDGARAFAQKRFHADTVHQLEQFYQSVLKSKS